jgi:hypothetical protein
MYAIIYFQKSLLRCSKRLFLVEKPSPFTFLNTIPYKSMFLLTFAFVFTIPLASIFLLVLIF